MSILHKNIGIIHLPSYIVRVAGIVSGDVHRAVHGVGVYGGSISDVGIEWYTISAGSWNYG